MHLYFGTYPSQTEGTDREGIWDAHLNVETGVLEGLSRIYEMDSPSFLALTPDREKLVAVSETPNGKITEFRRENTNIYVHAENTTGGSYPCHVFAVDGLAVVSNYGSGSVWAQPLPITQENHPNIVEGSLFQQFGQGANPERQEGPHAHFAAQLHSTQYVWVADLGADNIFKYQFVSDGQGGRKLSALGSAVSAPQGSGPRHFVSSSNGYVYVVGELDNRIHAIRVDASTGDGDITAHYPAMTGIYGAESSYPSHIALSDDGTRLYVAVRGADIMSVHTILDDGSLRYETEFSTGGAWPRHFACVGEGGGELAGYELLVVANQNSSTVDVSAYNPETREHRLLSSTHLPAPACVLPV
ncbi:lactonase family protein [Timonella sp. A28]|uniref:lactonase family protein n=1 Tax=Timonella sp. A28 TaxID=3442640 RepID=UPI003EBCDD3F